MQALSPLKKQFEDYLFSQRFDRKPKSLYAPFDYIFQLGGKRIRPVLLLAANEIFGGELEKALPAAMSIELFHNFSLIHDDIMDEADIRRGKPSIHKKFDTNTAILSGDAMFVTAYEYIFKTGKQELFELFNQTAKEVCEGQQMDMEFETRFDVTPEQYIEMISLKTAVLLGCSLQIGAALGGANQHEQEAIYNFGKNLGISFQIKDDILDTYAEQASFGKQIGGDILQNKRTYLMLHALGNASESDKETYLNWLDVNEFDPEEKIASVKEIYGRTNTLQVAEAAASDYYELSLNDLSILKAANIDVSILEEFAAQLLKREV